MPKTLEKTRKQIAKKRNGAMDNLHQNSRNSRRLHKAQVRDERLEKLAQTRKKTDQPLLERVAFFQNAIRETPVRPPPMEVVRELINGFVHQHDEAYNAEKSARRPGRPASTREDALKVKIVALEKEYQRGFYMPDLTSEANLNSLDKFPGSWSYLTNLSWVRVSPEGDVKPASFPPI